MKQEVEANGAPDRLVLVQTPYITNTKQVICFAFTTKQVIEVRNTIHNRPVPFADPFLLGLCPWKKKILPVIDLEKRFGLQGQSTKDDARYLILRTGDSARSPSKLYHAIVRVPGQISILAADDLPPVQPPKEIDSDAARGIFNNHNQVLILPDMLDILHVENGHS